MKSLLVLTTFIFISCGQETNLDTPTSNQTAVTESNIRIDNKNGTDTVIPNLTSETSATVNSGTTVALTFINSYVDNSNKMRAAIGISEFVNSSNLVTQEFKDEFNRILEEAYREDPELGLGADPILDAQDNPNKFVIDGMEGQYLTVRGADWPEFKLTMKVKQAADNWLVDGCGMINIPTDKRSGR